MEAEAVGHSMEKLLGFHPDLVLFASPNTSAPGPAKARSVLSKRKVPAVVLTDAPGKRVKSELDHQGLGYIVVAGDPLIGARREFLDSTEMAIFNANVIKILAITGIFRMVVQVIDRLIEAAKVGASLSLPRLTVDTDSIRDSVTFSNPYARVKAMAAYELLKKVAELNFQACFIEKEKERYIPLVACAHELVQAGAALAEEAREIEKYNDTLLRTPHSKEGRLKTKNKLLHSPK
jgi:methylenetetrahydromethanopterin dehydrogenase